MNSFNCIFQCHNSVLSAMTLNIHESQDVENLHQEAADRGTRTVREWIGQIITLENVYIEY